MVLNGRRLHEEGIEAVLLAYPVDPCRVPRCVHAWLRALHEGVHLLVRRDCRALKENVAHIEFGVSNINLEESIGGAAAVGAVLDLGLLGQVLGPVDRGRHLVRRQKSWRLRC